MIAWTSSEIPLKRTLNRSPFVCSALVLITAHRRPRTRANPVSSLAALATLEHPPVTSLFLGYRAEQVAHPLDGFGMLIPAAELRTTLGVIFSSTLFPGRAPEGHVALTVMLGGTRQPEFARLPTEKLHAAVERDLRELLGVNGPPVFQQATHWPRAIPQYNLGHERFLEAMTACERAYPHLFIGGQARDGISLPACLAAGEKLAQRAIG